ncbi:8298_t:CDS:2 [Diversispora eburnea]|uniref:8298_t:CDS:1 n=1 Tax=Diversispora eburnea TaxID=1213867 RepID=A0A9N9GTN5_9GLOM|nr:8298_t:CDS:2 [Diversispora eburnea]
MDFYKLNEIEDWACIKVVKYYRANSGQKTWTKVLDKIKKDLQIVASDPTFDARRKRKAQEIIDSWKVEQQVLATGNAVSVDNRRITEKRRQEDQDDREETLDERNKTPLTQKKKCKTESEKRTRSGRVAVPDYCELVEEATTDEDEQDSADQENKEEAETEKGLESQECDVKKTIPNDVTTDILGNSVEYSDTTKNIFSFYKEQFPDGDLIDLRLNSPFLKKLQKPIATSYLTEMDNMTELLVPTNVHEFLVNFFSQSLSAKEWNYRIDDLRAPDKDDFIMNAVVRVLRRTLPAFIKAFSLEEQNPLFNVTTIEHAHLNAFVHPCLDAFLWYIADIHYEYGEITSKNHINGNRADRAGYMTDADKYQLIYMEGSRPVAKDKKEIDDVKKITKNLKYMFAKIVEETIKSRQRLPKKLYVFGGQSFRLRIYLYFLDYCGTYRLNEVDNANLPRKFSEMKSFIYFYESVLKWALLVRDVTASFDNARAEQRPSRLSFADALLRLGD